MADLDETEIVTGSPSTFYDDFFEDDPWDEALAEINLDLNTDVNLPVNETSKVYNYHEVPIEFPYSAYVSQQRMMSKIIEGVKSGQHCLLESPTGTGKTAALLCGLLGWQRDCYKRHDNCSSVIDSCAEKMGGCRKWCGLFQDKENTKVVLEKEGRTLLLIATTTTEEEETLEESMFDSFTDPPTELTPESKQNVSPRKRCKRTVEKVVTKPLSQVCDYCAKKFVIDKSRPPKIYYCTRTHSQITQVVKQLKATAYKNVPMTILAGREPTCINPNTLNLPNQSATQLPLQDPANPEKLTLDDQCTTLRKNYYQRLKMEERLGPVLYKQAEEENLLPPICDYFLPIPELTSSFKIFQENGAFDLEDIKKEGEDCSLCPYYGSYALQNSSDIIFGSYNYLLHPEIRSSKDIQYINSVLVFDEAHNIEDICRSVFSFNVDCEYLDKRMIPLVEQLMSWATQEDSHVNISTMAGLSAISQLYRCWSAKIKEYGNAEVLRKYGPRASVKAHDIRKEFTESSLSSVLNEMQMTEKAINGALQHFEDIDGKEDNYESESEEYYFEGGVKRPFKVSSRIISYLKKIKQTLQYLYHEESDDGVGGLKDFNGFVTGQANPGRKARLVSGGVSRRSFMQQQNQLGEGPEFFFKFEIICLNPAVGFRALKNMAYSIIVASGTLTPLNSFASELATNFGVQLQAEHVIPKENVWTGVITTGPSQISLKLVKELQDNIVVQDDLGKILIEVCQTVPNGVLVFFPSYTLMRKLLDRWREYPKGHRGSVLGQITSKKYFFQEESKDKQAFKLNMERYKQLVKGDGRMNGCILFAVFRGKISEGIDFADEQARAVVTIGIPFSNFGAAEISSKRSYNDMRARTKRPGEFFLNGQQWYTIQAFRAMNQGFGRCVRHCKDWGALILIDSRLASQSNGEYISGWVKKSLKAYNNFQDVKPQLEKFVKKMTQETPTGSSSKRSHITPEYEKPPQEMDSQEDDILTQIVFPTDNHAATQLMPPVRASTPLNDSDVSNVAESSSEDSFGSELELGLGQAPSPVLPDGNVNADEGHYQESSPSFLDKTPSLADEDFNGEDDQELCDAVEVTECTIELLSAEGQSGNRIDNSNSEVFDVSMPSADASRNENSQEFDVSYHSDS